MFVLQISQVQKSDMAIYYCFKWTPYVKGLIFLKGVFLQVKDFPEADTSDITVTQDVRTDGSRSGPSVTSQCSVLPRSENQTCFDGHKVYWFRAKTNDTSPSFIYTREECEKITGGSIRKCVHGFSKNISSSNAGNYLCAVVTCGVIFMENAKKITTEDACRCNFQSSINVALGVALVLSFILLVFLVYNLKTKQRFCCKASPQTRGKTSYCVQEREGDSLVYSAPTIVARKSGKLKKTEEEFSTYTDVRLRDS
ncbi:uncharacterized protein LOC130923803 [Corythoichthys intestinalis]|uniref:uncharacterized protein LOC130923803 n=1 Tax=Corythoichthys intestinalis TaxID=161448 RepID=UPI0025A640B6|nr:uncharacterized protein LOC130923803 [Corythoichthys intestinalis]